MADLAELLAATGSACETTRGDYTGDGHLSIAAGASHNAFVQFLGTRHPARCSLTTCTSEIVRVASWREVSLPKKIGLEWGTPQSSGTATGTLAFRSNASDYMGDESLTGNGGVAAQHSVTLSWAGSSSTAVVGYNVYRSTVSGGPCANYVRSGRKPELYRHSGECREILLLCGHGRGGKRD